MQSFDANVFIIRNINFLFKIPNTFLYIVYAIRKSVRKLNRAVVSCRAPTN